MTLQLDDAVAMRPDYVIVGAGPAGCVLAGRLSEDPAVKVLLIEAGRSCDNFRVRLPFGPAMMLTRPAWDWAWQTPRDPTMNGRRITWSAGKVVGGGSSVHGQVHMRCLPADYDEWAEAIGEGSEWSYDDLLPYLIGCENYLGSDSPVRGRGGPLQVADILDGDVHPMAEALIAAGEDLGYERTDLNGERPEGFGLTQATQHEGRRFNAYDGYVRPHLGRPNLGVLVQTRVTRIVMEDGAAVGVEIDGTKVVRAAREVLVSAGTIASANLLMKSGIGPEQVLKDAGVPVQVHRDGVGRNLQEHSGVSLSRFVRDHWSLNQARSRPDLAAKYLYQLLLRKRGPFASPVVQAMGFVRTRPDLSRPDVQLHLMPFAYKMRPDDRSPLTAKMPRQPAVSIQATLTKPHVRGQVRITDANPTSAPAIDHRLLGDERDLQTLVAASKLVTEIFGGSRFGPSVVGNYNPPVDPGTDAEWVDFVRNNTNIGYHQVGTCRMGQANDPTAVVDPACRVIDARRLRVVDASVMPVVPSANTYIPTVAVAEKAAALISTRSPRRELTDLGHR